MKPIPVEYTEVAVASADVVAVGAVEVSQFGVDDFGDVFEVVPPVWAVQDDYGFILTRRPSPLAVTDGEA